jgi:uncharacterized membrane protein
MGQHRTIRASSKSVGAAVFCLLLASASAQAQSSYTLSVLSKPSSHKTAAPVVLDAAGNAYGAGSYYVRTVYQFDQVPSCWICAVYSQQEVKWPASTASTVSGILGLKDFLPLAVSADGSILAGVAGLESLGNNGNRFVAPIGSEGRPDTQGSYTDKTGVKRNGVLSTVPAPEGYTGFTFNGMNNAGVIAGNNYPLNQVGVRGPDAMVWEQGTYTFMDEPPRSLIDLQTPAAINDRQQVAVNVSSSRASDLALRKSTVTLWSAREGTRQTALGGLTGVKAVGINQAGQVLIRGIDFVAPRPIATHVWQNDVLTVVTGSVVKGQEVYGNAINDSGTVVGCLYNYNRTLSRAAFTPFIWQRGVMENLTTHLASKGLKLPSGQALGCPYAINNAGTILTSMYQVSNEKNTKWVRINALP